MEDTLRVRLRIRMPEIIISLNPCFNGRYSQRQSDGVVGAPDIPCLNPCFNGRYSQRINIKHKKQRDMGLNPCFNGRYSQRAKTCVPLFIVV